ncbi:hypothetical protein TRFO_09029 [Tritrichomonas foetus]|uniref:DH domain-containing protein n=1 Tax=Tritrichomonas foetus TaxID=1144522 RepID=A0A1J4JG48_9EUKA|nr:hypothetical protein TRFO_09029 [Tritrichomonas foetus]|eukprot:OHS98174.1 hypothetical protein TRFO_09029 [Tritrichomonas foetus]
MSFVGFVEERKPTNFVPVADVAGKTVAQLYNQLKIPQDRVFFIHTPLYEQYVADEVDPLKQFNDLIAPKMTEKYGRPKYFISIKPIDSEKVLYINVKPTSATEYDIPSFFVAFDVDEFKDKTAIDLKEKFSKEIDISINNGYLSFENINSKSEEKETQNPQTLHNSIPDKTNALEILNKAKTKQLYFNIELPESSINKLKHRICIIKEITSTEETYVKDLTLLLNFWCYSIKSQKLMKEDHLEILFKDFNSILAAQSYFLFKVQKCGYNYSSELADCFLEFAPAFRSSQLYVSDYPEIDELLRLYDKKPKFHEKILKMANEIGGRDLHSYMITPVQRMPRYILFLRDLMKFTPKSHPDSELLPLAYDIIAKLTREFDDATDYAKKQQDLLHIQQMITNGFVFLNTQHELSMQIPVQIIMRKKVRGEGFFYIFTDMVLLIQQLKNGTKALFDSPVSNFPCLYQWPTLTSITVDATGKSYHKGNNKKIYEVIFQDQETLKSAFHELEKLREKPFLMCQSKFIVNWKNYSVKSPLIALKNPKVVSFNENIYVVDGHDIIQIIDNEIKPVASLPDVVSNPIPAANSQYIYLYNTDSIYRFDPSSKGFQKLILATALPIRNGASMVATNNFLVIFGGKNGKKYFNEIILIYLDNLMVTFHNNMINMPTPRWHHAAFLDNDDTMHIFGGSDHGNLNKNESCVYSLNLNKLEWTVTDSTFSPRKKHSMIKLGKYIVLIGGSKRALEIIDTLNGESYEVAEFGNAGDNSLFNSSAIIHREEENIFVVAGGESIKYPSAQLLEMSIPPLLKPLLRESLCIRPKKGIANLTSELDFDKSGSSHHHRHHHKKHRGRTQKNKDNELSFNEEIRGTVSAENILLHQDEDEKRKSRKSKRVVIPKARKKSIESVALQQIIESDDEDEESEISPNDISPIEIDIREQQRQQENEQVPKVEEVQDTQPSEDEKSEEPPQMTTVSKAAIAVGTVATVVGIVALFSKLKGNIFKRFFK